MIIYGYRASKIGELDVDGTICSFCGQEEPQHVSIFGKYAHIFWIPLFPMGKKAIAECKHCKRTYDKPDFSPELRTKFLNQKKNIKRPLWHWFGLIAVIGLSLVLGFIVNVFGGDPDPRSELLKYDMQSFHRLPTMETDSISYKLKNLFDNTISSEIEPEDFEYYTKIKDNKALILVKIPELKKVEKKSRPQIIEMIEMITNSQHDLEGKEKYIGVHGKYNFMMLKTPTEEKNGNFIIDTPLYEFYGPKPITKKE